MGSQVALIKPTIGGVNFGELFLSCYRPFLNNYLNIGVVFLCKIVHANLFFEQLSGSADIDAFFFHDDTTP